jgi:hypothetical protein
MSVENALRKYLNFKKYQKMDIMRNWWIDSRIIGAFLNDYYDKWISFTCTRNETNCIISVTFKSLFYLINSFLSPPPP